MRLCEDRSVRKPVIPNWKDKVLFTPGPLTTSPTVKQAMLRDLGSRDFEFIEIVHDVRRRLVALGESREEEYTAVLMQGSGTFGLESVVASTIPAGGKLLVVVNGAYGRRVAQMARMLNIETLTLEYPEDVLPNPADVGEALARDPDLFQVCMCQCETTSGIMNPVRSVGQVVKEAGRTFLVDAMSAFGAVPTNLADCNIDYLCSSSNKCIEGVPGFSFILARLSPLRQTSGWARSLSLDLLGQYEGLQANGQFRFTPPVHAVLAFHQALLELEREGGVAGRAARYRSNHETLLAGMRALGFRQYLAPEAQGYIITSFLYPKNPRWDFERFYRRLNEEGYVIYPGKVGDAECFRIGTIGRLYPNDIRDLLSAVARTLDALGIELPPN